MVSDEPDLSRAARSVVDEDGVWLYHENVTPTDSGYWVEAKDLRIGDVFLGADGKLSTLTNVVRVEQSGGIAVFNFTVEGNHDYFVLAKNYDYGQSCVLVHNSCVVGQTMDSRVKPAAQKLDVDYLEIPEDGKWSWSMNQEWLLDQMDQAKKGLGRILDIGGERGKYKGPNAVYSMEKALLEENGFVRTFTGKWITATNGKKFRLYEWVLK